MTSTDRLPFVRISVLALVAVFLASPCGSGQGGGGKGGGKGGGGKGGNPAIACIRQKSKIFGKVSYTSNLSLMDADGSNETVILQQTWNLGSGLRLSNPSWSPEAEQLALEVDDFGGGPSGIFLVNQDGSGLAPLALGGREPAWSPDGTLIAYTRRGSGQEIAIAAADGSGSIDLTNTPSVDEGYATWSPGGNCLAYVASSGSVGGGTYESDLWVHDFAIGIPVNVTSGTPLSGMGMAGLDWARTQNLLVLFAGDPTISFDADIWTFDLDSGIATNLTLTPQDDYFFWETFPSWSSDDAQIVFARGDSLYVMQPDGSGQTLIAAGSRDRYVQAYMAPDWK